MGEPSVFVDAHLVDARPSYYRYPRTSLLDFLAAHRALEGRALDVGCAAGTLGAELLRRGFAEVIGIEPVSRVADEARTNLSDVIVGTFHGVDRAALGTFDLIVFGDSLEHMLDPWAALADAREMLNPGGALILSVPNVSHWSVLWPALKLGRWDYKDLGLLDRTHLRFFTPASLAKALGAAGFRVLARLGTEKKLPKRRRWMRPFIARLCPHLLVFQEYVIAIPAERIVKPS
jgi:2-polyprenyl-3-methyl-5-hydroxy-6-metoxy-1,4-benzoquinol methylase